MDNLDDNINPMLDDEDEEFNISYNSKDEEISFVLPDLDDMGYDSGSFNNINNIVLPDGVEDDGNHLLEDYVATREVNDYNYQNVKYGDYDSGIGVRSREDIHPDTYSGALDNITQPIDLDENFSNEDVVFDNFNIVNETNEFNESLNSFSGFSNREDNLNDLDNVLDNISNSLDDSYIDDLDVVKDLENNNYDLFSNDIYSTDEDDELDIEERIMKNFDIDKVIHDAITAGASDLHLTADDYVALTIREEIYRVKKYGIIPGQLTRKLMLSMISNVLEAEFTDELELDTSYVVRHGESKGRRTRLNIAKNLNNVNMTFRIVSDVIPTPESLNIPKVMQDWFQLPSGLILINGPTGTGKALYKDEKIPTINGFKKVKEIKLGDYLFDENGKPTKVISIHNSFDPKHYEVVFGNGQKIKTAGNHLWEVFAVDNIELNSDFYKELLIGKDYDIALSLIKRITKSNSMGDGNYCYLSDITELFSNSSPDLIKTIINKECRLSINKKINLLEALAILITESDIRTKRINLKNSKTKADASYTLSTQELFDYGVLNNKGENNWAVKYLNGAVQYPEKVLPINLYLLGEGLAKLFSSTFSGNYIIEIDKNKTIFIDLSKNFVQVIFTDNDAKSVKNYELSDFINSSYAQRISLLSGLMDYLGTVNNGECFISLNNSKVISALYQLVSSLGWIATEVKTVEIDNNIQYVFSFFPMEQIFTKPENIKKLKNYLTNVHNDKFHYINNIVEIDASINDFICFEVDSASHLYLASESFIPTHNTTTLASLLNQIALNERKKIVTVENPVEFLYGSDGKGLVVQREIGKDTRSFTKALNSAMRQNPNIILIGEVRDKTEIDALVRSAESGHLAISTMHTTSAPTTINRMIGSYVNDEKARILGTLADVSRGFANQTLVQTRDKKGLVAVREILPINSEISELIRKGDVTGIREYQIDHKITIEHELLREVNKGTITLEKARPKSAFPSFFDDIAGVKFD